jgi:hypothetical protein
MENFLTAYREFIGLYDTYLTKVERAFKLRSKKDIELQLYVLYSHLEDSKCYKKSDPVKIELSELQYNKNFDLKKLIIKIKSEVNEMHNRIDAIIENNNLLPEDTLNQYYAYFYEVVPWFWTFEKWLNDDFEKTTTAKKNQLSARQISLVFHFLKKTKHFRYNGVNTKHIKFLSTITGIGIDAFKKFIPDPMKLSKESKLRETQYLSDDLNRVAAFLDETGYPDAALSCRDELKKTNNVIDTE